jgi:hypothetical protein
VGSGGDILLAIGKSGIGGEAGTEFDKIAYRGGVDFDCPGGFAGVVKEIGAEGVNALSDLADSRALVAFAHPLESVADGAIGKGLEEGTAEWGSDQNREGFHNRGRFLQSSKKEGCS